MKRLIHYIERFLDKWHKKAHTDLNYLRLVEALAEIDKLKRQKYELGAQVKSLTLQLEIKQMNDFLQTGRL
jgi:hypothetical protein